MSRWESDDNALSVRPSTPLSESEYETVKRFGLHKPAVTDDVRGVRFGLALVTAAIAVTLLVIALVVFL